jgi:hypothetical protein
VTERIKPTTENLAEVHHLPGGDVEPIGVTAEAVTVSTWEPQDLTDALSGADVPPPEVFRREDGLALLYAGKTHAFIGESESGKTWAAMIAAAEVLAEDGMVLWVDYEDEARTVVQRLLALGVTPDAIRAGLHYVRPEEPLMVGDKYTTGASALDHLLATNTYRLAVVDGVTEGMAVEGLDPLGTQDFATWKQRLLRRLVNAGPAVVFIDHVPKSADNRGRYALGSQHKISGLSGAAYVFEVRKALGRSVKEPVTGVVSVSVSKDRPGHVRAKATTSDQVAPIATLELTAYPDGGTTGRLLPPDTALETPPLAMLQRIANYLHDYPGAGSTAVRGGVQGKAETIGEALAWMVRNGLATSAPKGIGFAHHLTDAGAEYVTPNG